jgi:cystathionine beta-lyase/cystathionine gamma-synthase
MARIKVSSKRTPIYRDSSFRFESIARAEKAFNDENEYPQSSSDFIYARYSNPGTLETEGEIAKLEGSEWALLTSSGMSAVDTALSIFQKEKDTGTWLFFSELYGGTNSYIDNILVERRGIEVKRFNIEEKEEKYDTKRLAELLDTLKPKLIFFEAMSNPLLIVVEGDTIIRMAKERNIKVIIDNTFATPYLWRPLERGADIVIHSATKYLSGHGNILAGVVCGNDPVIKKQAMIYRKLMGPILSPDDAYRLGTQLKTFHMRFTTQCDNAYRLAQRLDKHKAVKRVRYPGLESHVTHKEAKALFNGNGFGAMINIDLKGGREACDRFVEEAVDVVSYSPTLGDPETVLLHASTVWGEERFPYPGMLRLSIGFESYETLEKGILNALDEIRDQKF